MTYWRKPAYYRRVDFYEAALKRFMADSRSPRELKQDIDLPLETIRDIKHGIAKVENIRMKTARVIVRHYFPRQF